MAHYARIKNGIVQEVLVVDLDVLETGVFGDPSEWIQTSYNTHAGQHTLGGTPLRKNYAGIGYTYDSQRDAFIPPKIYETWTLNEETCQWQAPVEQPQDGNLYMWSDAQVNWIKL